MPLRLRQHPAPAPDHMASPKWFVVERTTGERTNHTTGETEFRVKWANYQYPDGATTRPSSVCLCVLVGIDCESHVCLVYQTRGFSYQEGRARRSGHVRGGAVRLEPPLQRCAGAHKAEKDRSILGFLRGADLLP